MCACSNESITICKYLDFIVAYIVSFIIVSVNYITVCLYYNL